VVLSNHGGRQLDFARSGIEVLVEVVAKLKEKRGLTFPNEKFQLFVDGGVRRATDVLKAIALGATAGTTYLISSADLKNAQSASGVPSCTPSPPMAPKASRRHSRSYMYGLLAFHSFKLS
jgi:hypothetical protein